MAPRGFTKTANSALFDERLSLQERAVYSMLLHLAWLYRPDREEGDVLGLPVPLPAQPELAELIGISEATLKRYLNTLRKAGYVKTERPRRQATLLYTIYARPEQAETAVEEPADQVSDDPSGQVMDDLSRARAGFSLEDAKSEDAPCGGTLARRRDPWEVPWEEAGNPPALVQDDYGQVQALNALARLTGISIRSPRMGQVAAALHGRKGNLDLEPGINRLFWLETAVHFGLTLPEVRARATANPRGYQAKLIECIEQRAALYKKVNDGVPLTPTALAKWWLDLEQTAERQERKAGMTREEMLAFRG